MTSFIETVFHLRRWLLANQLDPEQVEVTLQFKELRQAIGARQMILREMSPLTTKTSDMLDVFNGRMTLYGMSYRITIAPRDSW